MRGPSVVEDHGKQNGAHTMTIKVIIKNVYGNELIYPACETSHRFATLTGTKTLSRYAISVIKTLGYEVEVQTPSI